MAKRRSGAARRKRAARTARACDHALARALAAGDALDDWRRERMLRDVVDQLGGAALRPTVERLLDYKTPKPPPRGESVW